MASEAEQRARVGQCCVCQHARSLQSSKGSEFWLCEKSATDPRFKKYPPLPVWHCIGFLATRPNAP